MREIKIKYNPYRLLTTVTIDGNPPKANSKLCVGEKRLQEWIEQLPTILYDEFACRNFHLVFHGTSLDFEDVQSMAEQAEREGIHITLDHIPEKDHTKKEESIRQIFEKVRQGPYDELRKPDLIDAFNQAIGGTFSVNVIATMSAGKSTLINAILGQKLMPSKQTACTAVITTITDNDAESFKAVAYDSEKKIVASHDPVTLSEMKKLNMQHDIAEIALQGNIPFLNAEEMALVLVDTPGPNSVRNPEHRAATFRMLSESSKPLIIYVLNASQLAVNDDNQLLKSVAESMSVGGKQSKDRYLFVVNKLDEFDPEEDSVEDAINSVRDYLAGIGIENPNIYPLSAQTALYIRTLLKNGIENKFAVYEANLKVDKMNMYPEMHLEKYATLTKSEREELTRELEEARKNSNRLNEALIHSGIRSLELVVKDYVTKYARTAKIKNTVEIFSAHLESAGALEQLKQEISKNEDERDRILSQIGDIQKELSNRGKADELSRKIDEIDLSKQFNEEANRLLMAIQTKLTGIYQNQNGSLTVDEARRVCKSFDREARDIQAEFKTKIENLINKNVISYSRELIEEYNRYLSELTGKIGHSKINPFSLLKGDLSGSSAALIDRYTELTTLVVPNEKKKWYKFWTWFQPSNYIIETYRVDMQQLANEYFAPYQKNLIENKNNAVRFAKKQISTLKKDFKEKFEQLNRILSEKLDELKDCQANQKQLEESLAESRRNLEWLNDIQAKIDEIMEI